MNTTTQDRISELASIYKTNNMLLIQCDTSKIGDSVSFNHYINLGGSLSVDIDYFRAKRLHNN